MSSFSSICCGAFSCWLSGMQRTSTSTFSICGRGTNGVDWTNQRKSTRDSCIIKRLSPRDGCQQQTDSRCIVDDFSYRSVLLDCAAVDMPSQRTSNANTNQWQGRVLTIAILKYHQIYTDRGLFILSLWMAWSHGHELQNTNPPPTPLKRNMDTHHIYGLVYIFSFYILHDDDDDDLLFGLLYIADKDRNKCYVYALAWIRSIKIGWQIYQYIGPAIYNCEWIRVMTMQRNHKSINFCWHIIIKILIHINLNIPKLL
jgi:hypothetical protein